jgi:hypothetical protein
MYFVNSFSSLLYVFALITFDKCEATNLALCSFFQPSPLPAVTPFLILVRFVQFQFHLPRSYRRIVIKHCHT